jgi:PAS domain S-box-containing protein
LVVTDYSLPGFDARGVIQVVRESGRITPLIVVSDRVGEDVVVEMLLLGAADYLCKQNLTRLVSAVDRALSRARDRQQHERAEHMKTLIMANSRDLIGALDAKGRILEVSAAAERILGYRPEEMIGRNFLEYVHPGDRESTRAEARAIIGGRPTANFENRYLRRDGAVVDVMWSACWSLEDEMLIGVGRDVTEQKAARDTLRVALERLQLALAAGRAGIWEIDLVTHGLKWDEQMRSIYGCPAAMDPMHIDEWYEAIVPRDHGKLRALCDDASNGVRESFQVEFRIIRRGDGAPRVLEAMGTLVRDSSGKPERLIGINWDVTEERDREQRLASALLHEQELARKAKAGERAKGEFLAMMSHEIRTPMNGLLGFAEVLTQSSLLPEECLGHAQIIMRSGEAMLRILDDVLDFSRLEAGRLEIVPTEFSVREMLADAQEFLLPRIDEKGLQLHVALASDVPDVLRGDVGRLRQILLNLAGNAIKFTERGSVTLSLRRAPQAARDNTPFFELSVRDTGTGISPKQISRIFEPFTQADPGLARRFGGTGLGLTISRRLAELLGGEITVSSRPGEGSDFRVTVPLGEVDSVEVAIVSPPALPLDRTFAAMHPMRILLIEDDRVNLKLVLTLVRRLGYEPLAARDGREAVEIYNRERPDCLLMDLQMPQMDGIDATEKIRAIERASGSEQRAFIAALTANIFPEDREKCFQAGMDAYLNKPVKLADLAAMMAEARAFAR